MAAFQKFVDCPTRNNRTIDFLYANVRDASLATPLTLNLMDYENFWMDMVSKQHIVSPTINRG